MRKGYFSIHGEEKPEYVFEGYTDGTTWNGWANVVFTREQAEAWAKSSPYDYRFSGADGALVIYYDREPTGDIRPTQIDLGEGLVDVYDMNGYCFVELEKKGEGLFEALW